jgi:hypothetical protein
MKKLSLILLLILAIPALAADPNENSPKRIKAEQIRSSNGQFCYRCDYVLEDGWVTKVIDTANDVEWTLKPKETLYILPFGLRPESILQQVFRVSPDYGKNSQAPAVENAQPAKPEPAHRSFFHHNKS